MDAPDAVGYVIDFGSLRVYISGDTIYHARMEGIASLQPHLAFICINGRWGNMSAPEAAHLATVLRTQTAVPTHYNMFANNTADPADFTRALNGEGGSVQPLILTPGARVFLSRKGCLVSQKRVLKADWAFTATGADLIAQAAVALEDDRITYVGPASDLGQSHLEGAIIEEFPGHTLMPGMLDGHTHLTFTAGRNHEEVIDEIGRETDMQQVLRTAANAQKCLRGGLTTVRDLGGRRDVVPTVRDAINSGRIAGPRILSCNVPITVTGGHIHFVGWEADEEWELRKAVRTLIKQGADVIKICASGGNMTAESNPLMVQYSAQQLGVVVEEAHKLDTPVAAPRHSR